MKFLLFLGVVTFVRADVKDFASNEHPKLTEFLQEHGISINDVELIKSTDNGNQATSPLIFADNFPSAAPSTPKVEVTRVGDRIVYTERTEEKNSINTRPVSPRFQYRLVNGASQQQKITPKPVTKRYFYLYQTPTTKKAENVVKTIVNPGEKRINTIFIRTPGNLGGGQTIINQAGQVSEKTKVYVLLKEAEEKSPEKLPEPIPVPPPEEPEVIFIKYKSQKELSEENTGIVGIEQVITGDEDVGQSEINEEIVDPRSVDNEEFQVKQANFVELDAPVNL